MKSIHPMTRAVLIFGVIACCLLLGQMGSRAMPIPGISSQEGIKKAETLHNTIWGGAIGQWFR